MRTPSHKPRQPNIPCWIAALVLISAGVRAENSTNVARIWPLPPDSPRVVYVGTLSHPSDAGARQSGARRIANWFNGAATGDEAFAKPFGIALDENNNLCLTDTGANTVSFFDQQKKQWHRWEGIGGIRFLSPVSIAKQGDKIFVADSALGAIVAFDPAGRLSFQITNDLQRPSGLALHENRLWVTDSQQHCVLAFDLSGKLLLKFGRRGTGAGEFNFPTHIAADTKSLYVTDSINSRIQVFDFAGNFKAQLGQAGDGPGYFSRPKGVAVDTFGHVYVIDALFGNIQIFSENGKLLLDFGGPGTGVGEFSVPNGIAISSDNQIFVTDGYNHRVQVFRYVGNL